MFFFIGGVWSVLSGHGARPAGLEYLMMGFGGSMIIIGIIVVLELFEPRERKRIIALGTILTVIFFFYIGFSNLYWGARTYLSGSFRAQINGIALMIIGGGFTTLGIVILVLVRFLSPSRGRSTQKQPIPIKRK